MKALDNIYDTVSSLDNLFKAATATLARGRRFRGEGARFKFRLEERVLRLHELLCSERYRHGKYRLFVVRDPKVRVIAAAEVVDRVVHHAIHDVIEPRLDRMFIDDSYACRQGKGTHRALDRGHSFLRGHSYGLHLDVQSYFASIDHLILKGLLRRYIADERALRLLLQIVDSTAYMAHKQGLGATVTNFAPEVVPQLELALDGGAGSEALRPSTRLRGIPLGNLTSQFFANLYLNELDQFVKHELKARCYLRYMDDMLLFSANKKDLLAWEQAIGQFANEFLRVKLHESGEPRPVTRGIEFLGFRLFPNYRRLKRTSVSRFIKRMRKFNAQIAELPVDDQGERVALQTEIYQSAQSFNAHARHGSTYRIRKTLYDRFPFIEQERLVDFKSDTLTDADVELLLGEINGYSAFSGEAIPTECMVVTEDREDAPRQEVFVG